ncbi:MAG: alpha/beta hydrolase [candidate division Zixibacteria bacterium]|nr:alpha/beta hydrolase [candidate division Zixibacteria bacterium]
MSIFKMIVWLFFILIGVFAAFGIYLYFNQGRMVFIPMKELVVAPEQLNLTSEDVYIEVVPGEKINAWYFPGNPGRKTILFCHGNAGNISHRLETIQLLKTFEVNILLFDYRGYGRSDGQPTEAGVCADARTAYDWLVNEKKIVPENIILFGRSLGGAVAIDLASKVKCGGVVVESSFTSAAELGQKLFPYFPVKFLLRFKFDSLTKIAKLTCPVLVTHSPDDDLIPIEMGRQLYKAAREPKFFIELKGSHNDRGYLENQTYIKGLRDFIFNNNGI